MSQSHHIAIPARDGYRLMATLFTPSSSSDRGIVVIVGSATTVLRGFYHKFASFLCSHGFLVVTFDYRGTGDSVEAEWKGRPASYSAWAEKDTAGVIDWVAKAHPCSPIASVGHSSSGATFGLVPNNNRVAVHVGVAAPFAYWGDWDVSHPVRRFRMWALCHVLFPVVTRALGYYPGWWFGARRWERGVALEWARWARHPAFFVDERGSELRSGYDAYTGKMRFYSFSDDRDIAPARAVKKLAGLFRHAEVEVLHRSPEDYGTKHVGHAGFFRSFLRDSAWSELSDWLVEACASAPTGLEPPYGVEEIHPDRTTERSRTQRKFRA